MIVTIIACFSTMRTCNIVTEKIILQTLGFEWLDFPSIHEFVSEHASADKIKYVILGRTFTHYITMYFKSKTSWRILSCSPTVKLLTW